MNAQEKRQLVADKYKIIIGRNLYSQSRRDYCYKPYPKSSTYYSDCSSSISYAYKEAGLSFGILNTAGMYYSKKMSFVDVEIKNGIPTDYSKLRVGDMLLFAGSDSSRPLRIGHVEMVYSINSNGTVTICGHGSNTPSFKDLKTYCASRYNSWAAGGWRKGLVCVKRAIQDDEIVDKPIKQYGWHQEDGGWRYYLGDEHGNATNYVKGDWYKWKSNKDGNEYWSFFLGDTGFAISNDWFKYKDNWFYFDEDCIMLSSKWLKYKNSWYYLTKSGEMAKSAYIKSKDAGNDLYYFVNNDGIWESGKSTMSPNNYPYPVVI